MSGDFTDDERFDSISGMRVSEIKAELDLRGVEYADCFEADDLRKRLEEARIKGLVADTAIDDFNRVKMEAMSQDDSMKVSDMSTDDMEAVTAGDGTLPGGLKPEDLQKLVSKPEIMVLLQNPKFQDMMKAMTQGGPEAVKGMLKDDESYAMLKSLNELLAELGMVPPEL